MQRFDGGAQLQAQTCVEMPPQHQKDKLLLLLAFYRRGCFPCFLINNLRVTSRKVFNSDPFHSEVSDAVPPVHFVHGQSVIDCFKFAHTLTAASQSALSVNSA